MTGALHGLRVWITRPRPALAASARAWRRLGANVLAVPTVEIRACTPLPLEQDQLALALASAREVLVALPSPRAAEHFVRAFGVFHTEGRPWRVAALGEATAKRAARLGLELRLCSSRALGAVFAAEIVESVAPALVLLPSSDRRRPELGQALRAAGVAVVDLTVHRTLPVDALPAELSAALVRGEIDLLAAYSPSALAFQESLDREQRDAVRALPIACLGATTAAAARASGCEVVAEPFEPSEPALLSATVKWWSAR